MILVRLFLAFLKIGAFSFGGGYAVLALIQKEIIEGFAWISEEDFVNIVAIAEMTPGPIAVNASTFVGYKLSGILGAFAGTIGVITIPFLTSLIASIYFQKFKDSKQLSWILKGIRPAVLALIGAACIKIARISFVDYKSILIGVIVFASVYKLKLHPILAIFLAGILGLIFYGLF